MSERIALLAEAGHDIGTGHFLETLALTDVCQTAGMEPLVVANDGTPEMLLDRISGERWVVPTFAPDILQTMGTKLAKQGVRFAVTNFRHITNDQVSALAQAGLRIVCVDEWGKKHLDCDAVVNPSLVCSRHQYTSDHPRFWSYTGPQYLALSSEYVNRHAQPRRFEGGICSIAISMGGVDRTGATLRIIEVLLSLGTFVETHIVLGVGFRWTEPLEHLVKRNGSERWKIHRNVSNLASLFAASDVVFTAGGNTFYELACMGTPAIVLHEDDHEKEQGLAFQEQGFGVCLGAGTVLTTQKLSPALDRLNDPVVRQEHGDAGKRLVDGAGAWRICQILAELISSDSSLPSQFGTRGLQLHP